MVIEDVGHLVKVLSAPGLIGVRHDNGEVEKVSTEVLAHAPIKNVIRAMGEGRLTVEETCQTSLQ